MLTIPELLRGVLVLKNPTSLPPVLIGRFSASVNDCLVLSIGAPGISTEYFGSPSTTLSPVVMIFGRSKTYPIVSTWMNIVYESLHRHFDENLNGVWAGGAPIYLGQDESGYHEFQLILRVNVEG